MTAPRIPAPRAPLPDHRALTGLRRITPTDGLAGPFRALAVVRLGPGERAELAADGVEHAVYVSAGSGRAATGDVRVPLRPGHALTLPPGSAAALTAGRAGLEYVHAELAVPASGEE
ncbi:hypothetical protein OG871_28700 [Kitasatospora sp. NBC_00374]|uniref:hypothetical protein n=1 Tax=Kitasatospora sp. NBC_00374 TaxID=2975964 RepID=UPI0030E42D74